MQVTISKALSLGQGGEIGEIRQHRHHLSFQAVFPDGDGELVDGLGLDIHPIALTGLGLLGAVPGQSHNAAAGTQVTDPVFAPGRGKIRKQERIGAEFMLRGDTEPDPVTQGFKMITVIHGRNTASSGSAHRLFPGRKKGPVRTEPARTRPFALYGNSRVRQIRAADA